MLHKGGLSRGGSKKLVEELGKKRGSGDASIHQASSNSEKVDPPSIPPPPASSKHPQMMRKCILQEDASKEDPPITLQERGSEQM